MATSNTQGTTPSGYISGAAILQYRLVKLDSTAGQVVYTTAITDVPVGASMKSASGSGETISVQAFGKVKITAAAAISLGAQVMPDSGGGGKIATASGATARTIGIAEEAAGADGDIIEVRLVAPIGNGAANS